MSKVENLNDSKVIVLEQKPIISYDLVEQKGKEVSEKIASLNLEAIEANEDNLELLKSTRAELKKEFDTFESQRKMVKELVMKPYNDFDEAYKAHISSLFKDADLQLKEKVSFVDDEILSIKIDGIKEYFVEVNKYDFIAFDDLELKIIKSITDKKIKEQIDEYLTAVENNLSMIETLENSDRILAKYQLHKDLNRAISEAQVEVKREAEIKAQNEAKDEQVKKEAQEQINEEIEEHENAPQKFRASFTVLATKDQLAKLKAFMNSEEISYE